MTLKSVPKMRSRSRSSYFGGFKKAREKGISRQKQEAFSYVPSRHRGPYQSLASCGHESVDDASLTDTFLQQYGLKENIQRTIDLDDRPRPRNSHGLANNIWSEARLECQLPMKNFTDAQRYKDTCIPTFVRHQTGGGDPWTRDAWVPCDFRRCDRTVCWDRSEHCVRDYPNNKRNQCDGHAFAWDHPLVIGDMGFTKTCKPLCDRERSISMGVCNIGKEAADNFSTNKSSYSSSLHQSLCSPTIDFRYPGIGIRHTCSATPRTRKRTRRTSFSASMDLERYKTNTIYTRRYSSADTCRLDHQRPTYGWRSPRRGPAMMSMSRVYTAWQSPYNPYVRCRSFNSETEVKLYTKSRWDSVAASYRCYKPCVSPQYRCPGQGGVSAFTAFDNRFSTMSQRKSQMRRNPQNLRREEESMRSFTQQRVSQQVCPELSKRTTILEANQASTSDHSQKSFRLRENHMSQMSISTEYGETKKPSGTVKFSTFASNGGQQSTMRPNENPSRSFTGAESQGRRSSVKLIALNASPSAAESQGAPSTTSQFPPFRADEESQSIAGTGRQGSQKTEGRDQGFSMQKTKSATETNTLVVEDQKVSPPQLPMTEGKCTRDGWRMSSVPTSATWKVRSKQWDGFLLPASKRYRINPRTAAPFVDGRMPDHVTYLTRRPPALAPSLSPSSSPSPPTRGFSCRCALKSATNHSRLDDVVRRLPPKIPEPVSKEESPPFSTIRVAPVSFDPDSEPKKPTHSEPQTMSSQKSSWCRTMSCVDTGSVTCGLSKDQSHWMKLSLDAENYFLRKMFHRRTMPSKRLPKHKSCGKSECMSLSKPLSDVDCHIGQSPDANRPRCPSFSIMSRGKSSLKEGNVSGKEYSLRESEPCLDGQKNQEQNKRGIGKEREYRKQSKRGSSQRHRIRYDRIMPCKDDRKLKGFNPMQFILDLYRIWMMGNTKKKSACSMVHYDRKGELNRNQSKTKGIGRNKAGKKPGLEDVSNSRKNGLFSKGKSEESTRLEEDVRYWVERKRDTRGSRVVRASRKNTYIAWQAEYEEDHSKELEMRIREMSRKYLTKMGGHSQEKARASSASSFPEMHRTRSSSYPGHCDSAEIPASSWADASRKQLALNVSELGYHTGTTAALSDLRGTLPERASNLIQPPHPTAGDSPPTAAYARTLQEASTGPSEPRDPSSMQTHTSTRREDLSDQSEPQVQGPKVTVGGISSSPPTSSRSNKKVIAAALQWFRVEGMRHLEAALVHQFQPVPRHKWACGVCTPFDKMPYLRATPFIAPPISEKDEKASNRKTTSLKEESEMTQEPQQDRMPSMSNGERQETRRCTDQGVQVQLEWRLSGSLEQRQGARRSAEQEMQWEHRLSRTQEERQEARQSINQEVQAKGEGKSTWAQEQQRQEVRQSAKQEEQADRERRLSWSLQQRQEARRSTEQGVQVQRERRHSRTQEQRQEVRRSTEQGVQVQRERRHSRAQAQRKEARQSTGQAVQREGRLSIAEVPLRPHTSHGTLRTSRDMSIPPPIVDHTGKPVRYNSAKHSPELRFSQQSPPALRPCLGPDCTERKGNQSLTDPKTSGYKIESDGFVSQFAGRKTDAAGPSDPSHSLGTGETKTAPIVTERVSRDADATEKENADSTKSMSSARKTLEDAQSDWTEDDKASDPLQNDGLVDYRTIVGTSVDPEPTFVPIKSAPRTPMDESPENVSVAEEPMINGKTPTDTPNQSFDDTPARKRKKRRPRQSRAHSALFQPIQLLVDRASVRYTLDRGGLSPSKENLNDMVHKKRSGKSFARPSSGSGQSLSGRISVHGSSGGKHHGTEKERAARSSKSLDSASGKRKTMHSISQSPVDEPHFAQSKPRSDSVRSNTEKPSSKDPSQQGAGVNTVSFDDAFSEGSHGAKRHYAAAEKLRALKSYKKNIEMTLKNKTVATDNDHVRRQRDPQQKKVNISESPLWDPFSASPRNEPQDDKLGQSESTIEFTTKQLELLKDEARKLSIFPKSKERRNTAVSEDSKTATDERRKPDKYAMPKQLLIDMEKMFSSSRKRYTADEQLVEEVRLRRLHIKYKKKVHAGVLNKIVDEHIRKPNPERAAAERRGMTGSFSEAE